jgi:hypothetical protein
MLISPSPPPPDETETLEVALEELTKGPVPDRVNAKLAAKQFEALVSKMKTEPHAHPHGHGPLTRGISPGRERPLLSSPKTVPHSIATDFAGTVAEYDK